MDLDAAAARLGGPIFTAAGLVIGPVQWGQVDNELEFVDVETDEPDDPLVVHTRRGAIPASTALGLMGRHAERCGRWAPEIVLPDSLAPTELVVDGQRTAGYLVSGDTVSAVIVRVSAVTVTVLASATWLNAHRGWPHLVTGHGDTDEMERARITGQPR